MGINVALGDDEGDVVLPPGALPSFATVSDVTDRGHVVLTTETGKVTELLADVSDAIRARGRRFRYDVDAAVASGALSQRTVTRVTVAAAQRVRDAPTGPLVSQEGFGPFTRTYNLDAMYLRSDELRDIGIPETAAARGFMGDNPAVSDVYSPLPYPAAGGSVW